MWYWKDTLEVTMLRCVHVPKFHDPIAQIPEHVATVWPMTADALGRVLEISENWNTQRVFNIHRRSLQRTLRDCGDTNRLTRSLRDAPH